MLHSSLLETVAFFDLFDWPLTENELFKLTHQVPAVSAVLEREAGFVFLKGRRELIFLRQTKEVRAAYLWQKTRSFISWLPLLPFVRAVFVSNKLAYNNINEGSDIDLSIVIKSGRLWFARLLVSLWLLLWGQKRQGKRVAGRFCLNFFVTEENLDLSRVKIAPQDPYLEFWLFTLAPVFDYGVLSRLAGANAWLRGRFPWYGESTYLAPIVRVNGLTRSLQFLGEALFYLLWGPFGEKLLRYWQLTRIKSKQKMPFPSEVASDSMLKFHPQDKRFEISQAWAEKLSRLYGEIKKI